LQCTVPHLLLIQHTVLFVLVKYSTKNAPRVTVEGFWHWRRNRIDFGGAGADSEVVLLL
jgi:hypothetical protein